MSDEASEPSDEVLLDRYRNEEDLDAFRRLLERYRRPIFTFVLRSSRDPAIAEEIHQEVFLRLVQRCDAFRGQSKFSTWLFTIARNLCIDHSRKSALRQHRSLDAPTRRVDGEGSALVDQVATEAAGPGRASVGRELRERINGAVDALPDEQRTVFLLRQVHHLPFKEVAAVCGVPENTVKSRMRYALERLQEALSDYRDYAEEVT